VDAEIQKMMTDYAVTDETRHFLSGNQRMYIDGRFVDGANGVTIDVVEPSTARYLTEIQAATDVDVDLAVAAANRALREGPWSTMRPNVRQRLLLRLADLVERDAQIIGEIETVDNGKAIGPCIEMDILGGADLLRYMAGFATKLEGSTRNVSVPGEHLGDPRGLSRI
jgi:phenylacetaldehyde dehydrogenase